MTYPSLLRLSLLFTGLLLAAPVSSAAPGAFEPTSASSSTPEANPSRFTLQIRNGQIFEGDKPIASATIGGILDYLHKKNIEFTLALGPGVADVNVGDMVLNLDSFNSNALGQAIAVSANEPLVFNSDFPALVKTGQQQREVAVFNLASYLNPNGNADEKDIKSKVESLTQIITNTLTDVNPSVSSGGRPAFQFHSGANLLVVTGYQQAIDVVTKVVNALIRPVPSPNSLQAYYDIASPYAGLANSDSTATYPRAQSLPASSQNVAQLQAALDASKRTEALQKELLSSQTPEQAKQLQKALDELGKSTQDLINKTMQNLNRLEQARQNNNLVIIPGGNSGGGASSQPYPGNSQSTP